MSDLYFNDKRFVFSAGYLSGVKEKLKRNEPTR